MANNPAQRTTMRLGFYQFDVVFGDKGANLRKVRDGLAGTDFDLMVLPELFTTGCIFTSAQQARDLSEAVPGGETTRALLDIARAGDAYIIGSLLEREGERLYNTAVIAGPDGLVGRHRKVHLTGFEQAFFTPGSGFEVYDILGTPTGILLCFDLWSSEAGKELAARGARLICNPSNFCGEDSLQTSCRQAQALSVHMITANRLGMDRDTGTGISFIGASQIIGPDGGVIHRAGNAEALAVKEISL